MISHLGIDWSHWLARWNDYDWGAMDLRLVLNERKCEVISASSDLCLPSSFTQFTSVTPQSATLLGSPVLCKGRQWMRHRGNTWTVWELLQLDFVYFNLMMLSLSWNILSVYQNSSTTSEAPSVRIIQLCQNLITSCATASVLFWTLYFMKNSGLRHRSQWWVGYWEYKRRSRLLRLPTWLQHLDQPVLSLLSFYSDFMECLTLTWTKPWQPGWLWGVQLLHMVH